MKWFGKQRRRRRRSVHCLGCAHFMVLPNAKGGVDPVCVATAEFVSGPLRSRINVTGVVSAEERNINNDCGFRQSVSIVAYKLKLYMHGRLPGGKKANRRRIKDYSYKAEDERRQALLNSKQKTNRK